MLRSLGDSFRHKIARQSTWRAFVGWQEYYGPFLSTQAGPTLAQHSGPWVGDTASQVQVSNGLGEGKRAGILWAPPGCGKSRFALELARRLEKGLGSWQVLFVHHDEAVVREELPQIMQLKRVVLIVDDAHSCPEIVQLLASAVAPTSADQSMCLVCTSRSTQRAQVSRAINYAFSPGLTQELDLGRPNQKLVRSLIDQLLPKASPLHRDTIERFVRQSYFGAVLVCTLLSREAKLPQSFQRQYLRERMTREPLKQAAEGVCPIETAVRALAVYAAVCPVARDNLSVRDLAAQLSGLASEKLNALIDRALTAGVFRENGNGLIRPVPDLLADLFLEEACLDAQGKPTAFSTDLLQRAFALDPHAAANNCADVGQLFGTDKEVDLVSKLFLERARLVAAESEREVRRLLQSCQHLATRRPATVVEIVGILETRGILRRTLAPGDLHALDSIETDAYTLLLNASEVDPTVAPLALRLGRALYTATQEDKQSRHSVRESLAAYCRFELGRKVAVGRATVETLRTWITDPDVQIAALAASLSGQFLILTPSSPTPEVWAVRDIAVDTLVRGTSHADAIVQCAATGALERYAYHDPATGEMQLDAWRPQLSREIELLSAAVIQLGKATSSLPVRATAEHQGWLWWAHEIDALHRAGSKILESIPDSDPYRLWKSLYAQALPVHTTIPTENVADSRARLEYFQKVSTTREESAADQARQLFDKLDPGQADNPAWRTLWLTAVDQSPRITMLGHADVMVGEFARRHPDPAWSFITPSESSGPLFVILPMLLAELRKHDRERYSEASRDVPPGTPLEEAWLRVLWASTDLDEAESTLLARGLGSEDAAIRHRAAAALLHATGNDRVNAFKRVFANIEQHPTDADLWELVIEQFVLWTEGVLPPQPGEPSEPMQRVADELIRLFQSCGSRLRWGFQRHTRQLAKAFSILAVIRPQQLQDWMKRDWSVPTGPQGGWKDESPLSISRLTNILDPLRNSPAIAYWVDAFADWMLHENNLNVIGAQGLAKLCALNDPKIMELAEQIGQRPAEASLKSFTQFIRYQKSDRAFAQKALGVLEVWSQFPGSYGQIEEAVIGVMLDGASTRLPGKPSTTHVRALEAIDALKAKGVPSGLLLTTIERAEREIRNAIAADMARDEESSGHE